MFHVVKLHSTTMVKAYIQGESWVFWYTRKKKRGARNCQFLGSMREKQINVSMQQDLADSAQPGKF